MDQQDNAAGSTPAIDSNESSLQQTVSNEPTQELSAPPEDGIRAFDQQGREVIVPREEWRANVLPNLLNEVFNQPENLYMVLLNSFNDGFFAEVLGAAQHLAQTDPIPGRGTCMWAIALMQTARLDEAQQVLEGFLATHPVDAIVLVNLAKVFFARGERERGEQTLAQALEVDPNVENGVALSLSDAESQGGNTAAEQALNRIAAMPLSWRAQVWLARVALTRDDLATARNLYADALERAPRPVPIDLLMQMSGDLGGRGYLAELIDFTSPYYLAETHGLPVGNNLIKANFDLGRLNTAENLKNQLARLNGQMNRPDWAQAIAFWEAEIGRRRSGADAGAGELETGNGTAQAGLQIGLLRIDGPIWLPVNSPARGIFGSKPQPGPSVVFLGGTAELPPEAADPANRTPEQAHLADILARMTRALPLFFAEQTDLLTGAEGRAMLPWATGPASGFVVSGSAWTDAVAVQMLSDQANAADYAVTVHVDGEVEPWTAMLGFVRTADGTRVGELEAEFSPADPEAGLRQLAGDVVDLLGAAAGQTNLHAGSRAEYTVPGGSHFLNYLLQLEQLLAVRCASMDGAPPTFLVGEREIVAGELALCRAEPANVAARLVLLETVTVLERTRPGIGGEIREPLEQLMNDHPLTALNVSFA